MLQMLETASFWGDVLKILTIDILLSGDNAVLIALACRNLPHAQRRQAIVFGVVGAIGLRVVLTFFAVGLLSLPYLKVIGAILLLWIGIKLILPEKPQDEGEIQADSHLWGAIKTIMAADFIMSLDNVVGVAAAAHGDILLLVFGLVASIPFVAMSSQWVLKLIDRFSAIIYGGAGLLGYVAGELLVSDPLLESLPRIIHHATPALCAVLVVVTGLLLAARMKAQNASK
jgi:YjbE family integral membrane protein